MKIFLPAFLVCLSCAKSGLGGGVRADIQRQFAKAHGPMSDCYEEALKRNRRLRGRMIVGFVAEAKTGKFADVRVLSNELPDGGLEQCIRTQVSILALESPQSTKVDSEYPLDFSPSN